MNEYSIGEKLRGFRAEGANFVGEASAVLSVTKVMVLLSTTLQKPKAAK